MAFKKLNKLQQLLLKMNSSALYKDYKFLSKVNELNVVVKEVDPYKKEVHFKHSGNAGDIIYSIPTIYALAAGRNIHLHLSIDQQADYGKMSHPLGDVRLNEKMANMLRPLILDLPNFESCTVHDGATIDVDLDVFRQFPFNYRMGHIARWYFLVFGVNANLGNPWLRAAPSSLPGKAIVIARSKRYRNPGICYDFLARYPNTYFIGMPEEYSDMKEAIPQLIYLPVHDFREMASIIAGSKVFIGNQSFPFSIAEGLKVKRILEVYYRSPNVIVEGENGYDFCFQPQFEKIFKAVYEGK